MAGATAGIAARLGPPDYLDTGRRSWPPLLGPHIPAAMWLALAAAVFSSPFFAAATWVPGGVRPIRDAYARFGGRKVIGFRLVWLSLDSPVLVCCSLGFKNPA
jgi:hypothetical protein